jgi:RHS repeat-associated protein
VSPPLIPASTFGYYYGTGQPALVTDANGQTSYSHFFDPYFSRPTSTVLPDGGWTYTAYNSTETQVDSYTGITGAFATSGCTGCRQDEVLLDILGRVASQKLMSDPEGIDYVLPSYDTSGRMLNTTHPYRTTSDATYGLETPTYDGLNRIIKVTHQDTTYSQMLFGAAVNGTGVNLNQLCSSSMYGLGFPVLWIDEAGKRRETWTDGFGRTIEGDEPDSSGNLTSYTCYSYDPLGNLLQIVHGSQTRTYGYDTVSRITSVTIPELANCAVTYTYDNNSNVQTRTAPAPNQSSCTTTVTTTYTHDALNRLTQISYGPTMPVATPTVKYAYDGNAPNGCSTAPPTLTDSNPKGRMTSMCDGSGATSWAHDAAGRIITEKRIIQGSPSLTTSYSYNLDGSIATVTYPTGKVITYTMSNAQRLTAAKDVANNVQFATAASYTALGMLQGLITGQISGGFGGITESHNYNSSLEYTSTKATSTAGTAMDLTLNYNLTGGDNGTVTSITNNADNGRTQTLSYDSLNRILAAQSSNTTTGNPDCWGQVFGPDGSAADDALGNFTNINSGTQSQPPCQFGMLTVSVDGNNHITTSGFGYDAAGNMTADAQPGVSYSFDAENRLVEAAGVTNGPYCYAYDGLGLRVAKKSGANTDCSGGTVVELYWRSISGDSLAETDGSGNTLNEYVFFTGRRVASRDGSGAIFYYFADQLGSTRTITTGSGTGQTPGQLCYDADFTPYGQEISYTARLQTTACPPNYKFTGYERDPETGLDYAFARYYSSRLGRFLSADRLVGSIGDLQSHGAYAYTRNNPFNAVDPLGLTTCTVDVLLQVDPGVTLPALDSVKSQVQALLGQGVNGNNVAINFVSQGGDYTLKFQNPAPTSYLTFSGTEQPNGATVCFFICSSTAAVNVGNTEMNNGLSVVSEKRAGIGLGTVGAHELFHAITSGDDLSYKDVGGNLMSLGSNPLQGIVSQGSGVTSETRLTDKQIQDLIDACNKKNKNKSGNGAGGGGGGGGAGDFGFLEFEIWLLTQPIEVVTHRFL